MAAASDSLRSVNNTPYSSRNCTSASQSTRPNPTTAAPMATICPPRPQLFQSALIRLLMFGSVRSDLHAHQFLVRLEGFVTHLQRKLERQARFFEVHHHLMQVVCFSQRHSLDGLIVTRHLLVETVDGIEHGVECFSAALYRRDGAGLEREWRIDGGNGFDAHRDLPMSIVLWSK